MSETNYERIRVHNPDINFHVKPKPKWQCELFGITGGSGVIVTVIKPPFILWRWMQFLILGNRWSKIK
jgi:hypothetical protein